jgi:methylated-DNA-[protein]-cysteine S-methyltransferase
MNQPPIIYTSTFQTPVGDFSVAVSEEGALVATAFGGERDLESRSYIPLARHDEKKTGRIRAQVAAYFESASARFDFKLAPKGTDFQKRVWAALLEIPVGSTRSYGEIARQLKSSARAVGQANGANPICLIIPCHRVIGADGSLAGYAYGPDLKRRLLEHEGVPAFFDKTPVIASKHKSRSR